MKTFSRLGVIVLAALLLVACDHNTVKGSGKVITQSRGVAAVEHIKAVGNLKLFVVAGKSPQISVKADDNLQPYIMTTVKDDTLDISTKKGYRLEPTTPVTVEVDVDKLKSLSTAGSIQVHAMGVDSDNFAVHAVGDSGLVLSGKVDKTSINIAGRGRVDARRLIAQEVSLAVDGTASVSVHANRKLNVRVAGSGQVVYFGNPPFLNQSIFGKGTVEKGSQ